MNSKLIAKEFAKLPNGNNIRYIDGVVRAKNTQLRSMTQQNILKLLGKTQKTKLVLCKECKGTGNQPLLFGLRDCKLCQGERWLIKKENDTMNQYIELKPNESVTIYGQVWFAERRPSLLQRIKLYIKSLFKLWRSQ